ncbi:MAG: hypothetical protein QGH39_10725 [Candidatus Thermoplasmatota archaeon]|nr:hypothetical protein [Candidatus Thermoplasmatota archaeon]MDP7266018.1 hypothetical protein [Candidatus Thermoplasmatota archaeon]
MNYKSNESTPEIEDYLKRLRKKLRFMSKKTKNNVLDEVRSHLHESALDLGGLNKNNAKVAIANYGDPKEISKSYKRMYGYGKFLSVVFIILGFVMGILTVPLSAPALKQELITFNNICLMGTLFLTTLLFFIIILSGVKFGRWTGMLVGFAAFASRGLTMLVVTNLPLPEKIEIVASGGPCFFFIIVSLMMPVSGFVAGRVFIKFKKKDDDVAWD